LAHAEAGLLPRTCARIGKAMRGDRTVANKTTDNKLLRMYNRTIILLQLKTTQTLAPGIFFTA
jgi:hypothetical protein